LGEEILPYDILPTTATVNRITYGLVSSVKVCFKDGREQVIAIHQLADYVTKLTTESEAVAATVKETIVYYPLPYFQDNHLEIIDTPGLNDDTDMTSVTLSILRQCDIAIMIISAQSPFSISEQKFLTQKLLKNGIRRVLFVVNGIDHLNNPEDAERVVQFIKNRIQESVQEWAKQQSSSEPCLSSFVKPNVWGISAFEALQGKQTKNMALLAKSRFMNFEYDLKRFLNQERGIIILEGAIQYIITVGKEIIKTLIVQEAELELEQSKLRGVAEAFSEKIAPIRNLKADLVSSIHATILNAKQQAKTSVSNLENDLQKKANYWIGSTSWTASNFNDNYKDFISNLSNNILSSLQDVCEHLTCELQIKIEEYLDFLKSELIKSIQIIIKITEKPFFNIESLDLELSNQNKPVIWVELSQQISERFNQQRLSKLSFSFPNNSELFLFEDNPSGAGTTWGAVIGFVVTGGNPGGAALGAAIGAGVGNNMRAKKFKENYEAKVRAEIEKQLKIMNVNEIVDRYISEAFYPIVDQYSLIIQEVNFWLEMSQTTLSQYLGQQEAIAWDKRQRLNNIRTEVEKILDDVQKFFGELFKIESA